MQSRVTDNKYACNQYDDQSQGRSRTIQIHIFYTLTAAYSEKILKRINFAYIL